MRRLRCGNQLLKKALTTLLRRYGYWGFGGGGSSSVEWKNIYKGHTMRYDTASMGLSFK